MMMMYRCVVGVCACVVGGIQGSAWHCTVYKKPRCYKWFLESPAPAERGEVGQEWVIYYFSLSGGSDRVKWNPVQRTRWNLSNFRISLSTSYRLACVARQTHTCVHVADDVL